MNNSSAQKKRKAGDEHNNEKSLDATKKRTNELSSSAGTSSSSRVALKANFFGGGSNIISDTVLRDVDKARLHRYFRKIKKLNDIAKEFALWIESKVVQLFDANNQIKEEEAHLLSQYESDFETFRHLYTRQVTFYQELYQPNAGTSLLLCGTGDCNQLGMLDSATSNLDTSEGTLEAKRPRDMKYLKGTPIVQVACGGLHTLALRADGTVLSWGCNDNGALGRLTEAGENTNTFAVDFIPDFIPDFIGNSKSIGIVLRIACGDCQSLALTLDGQVYMWGCYKDKEGKLYRDVDESTMTNLASVGNNLNWKNAVEGMHIYPVRVGFRGKRVQDIRCGFAFNAAITEDGYLYTWGINESGELGRPAYTPPPNKEDIRYKDLAEQMLTPLPPLWLADDGTAKQMQRKVESVACGGYHMLVTSLAGFDFPSSELFSTGLNNYGQLGHDDTESRSSLTHVEALSGYNIDRIAAGTHHSLCTDEDGNLIAFGRGDSGQLGITDRQPAPSYFEPRPVILKVLEDEGDKADVSQISCGGNHNVVITRKGSVYTWGYGEQHALGHGVGKDEYCPRKLNVFAGKRTSLGVKVHQVAGGGQHSAFICTIDEEQAMHAS